MITVRLQGGMGNQMFQYAFGRALAERNGDDLVLDKTFLLDRTPRREFVYRNYDLDVFGLDPRFTLLSRAAARTNVPFLMYGLSRYCATAAKVALGAQRYVVDRTLGTFQEAYLNLEGNLYLDGYWQCEKYFRDISDLIRGEFSYRQPITAEASRLSRRIRSVTSVCVNVRRGDYVSLPGAARTLGFVGEEYYREGVYRLSKDLTSPHFFVFSDDIEWCEKNLEIEPPCTFVSHQFAGPKFGQYFHLMSSCKHFLIPNSSFAWWAAWLGGHPEKKVIAPARWFRDPTIPAHDLVPADWARI